MPTVKQLPPRSKVKTADTWDLSSLFPNDEAWEKAFGVGEADRRLRRVPGQAGRRRRDAGRVPEVRRGLRPRRRAAGHLRLSEDGRGHDQQPLPADAGPVHQRGRPRGRGRQLHPPGDPGHSRRPDEAVPGRRDAGPVPAAAGAAAALQAAHARAARKRSCWPCRPRWPRPPARSSASSTTPT